MRKFIFALVFIVSCFTIFVNAEEPVLNRDKLYVNNSLIDVGDTVIIKENYALLPFRTILEELGATVEWNEATNDIVVSYNNELYVCYISEPNPGYSKYFYVKYMDDSKNKYSSNHIYLSPMSLGGAFEMINDRIYLYQQTAKHLFEALGCKVEIYLENKEVHIDNKVDDNSAILGTD